jgi:hypothetical protein
MMIENELLSGQARKYSALETNDLSKERCCHQPVRDSVALPLIGCKALSKVTVLLDGFESDLRHEEPGQAVQDVVGFGQYPESVKISGILWIVHENMEIIISQ